MNRFLKFVLWVLAGAAMACGSSSSSDSTTTSSSATNAGAAVAAIFGTGSSSNVTASLPLQVLDFFIKKARAQSGGDTCTGIDEGGPANVDVSASGSAGTYGSTASSVTLTTDNFCKDADGTDNTGTGLYGAFTLTGSATATCTDSTTVEMTAGTGVFRNTSTHFPEVYGTFTIDGSAYDCTMLLNEDQSVDSASCTDSEGAAVTLTSDVTCTIDAG